MAGIPAGRDARSVADSARHYERRGPDETLLYQIIEQHYPVFSELMAEQGRELPAYVRREFEDFLKRDRLEHGYLRVRCERCRDEKLVTFSCKRRGFCPSCGARRCRSDTVESASQRRAAMTWIQRLKRVFRVDVETCRRCGGKVKNHCQHRRLGGGQADPRLFRSACRAFARWP